MKAFMRELLSVQIYQTRQEMGQAAADACEERIKKLLLEKSEINMMFAAAPSQNEFLDALVKKSIDFSKINAFHMDEYAGLSSSDKQSFAFYLKSKLFDKVSFKSVSLIDGLICLTDSCNQYTQLLQKYKPDITCMGIGENSHLAFNDPHVADFSDKQTVKMVELDELCRQQQVNDNCFDKLENVPKFALSVTITGLMCAKYIICTVPGERKANAVKKTLFGKISEACPASILRRHSNAVLFLDENSSKDILGDL